MSVNFEEFQLVTNRSSRYGTLFSSVGQYVVLPVDRNEYYFTWITFENSQPFFVVIRELPIFFVAVIQSG